MFRLLKKKSYLKVGGFLLVCMAITFFVVYQTYSALLSKDFLNKQKFLAQQTTQTLKEYFLSIDEQTDLLINKNLLPQILSGNTDDYVKPINFDNIDFYQVDIHSADKLICTTTSLKADDGIISLDTDLLKKKTQKTHSVWYIQQDKSKKQANLIYIKPITNAKKTVGYLTAWIDPEHIKRILSIYTNAYTQREPQLFTDYISAAIMINDKIYNCCEKPLTQKDILNKTDTVNQGTYIYRNKMDIGSMQLIIKGSTYKFDSCLSVIRKFLVVTYVVMTLIILLFLRLFTSKIDDTINTLYSKMQFDDEKVNL